MKTLSNLLARYAHIQAPNATLKKAFIKAVEDVIEVTLTSQDLDISKKTVRIKAPSVVKNEIRINQQEILKNVSEELKDSNILTAVF